MGMSIGDYEQDDGNNEIGGSVSNLPSVVKDIANMTELMRDLLNYCVYPCVNSSIRWTQEGIQTFIEERAHFLSDNIGKGMMFDSLILIISCHGLAQHIITSDLKKYSNLAILRTFAYYAVLREIPRFVLFDCCSGGSSKQKSDATQETKDDKGKAVEVDDIMDGDEDHEYWIGDDKNPNHRLARVEAANEGFISVLNKANGSYVVYKFYQKYCEALDKKKNGNPMPFLYEIFDEIQQELQDAGKQLPESVWNTDTKYLIFASNKKKDVKMNNDVEMLDEIVQDGVKEETEDNAGVELQITDVPEILQMVNSNSASENVDGKDNQIHL